MTDAEFICGLMRQNTDELGFIPSSAIQHVYIPRNRFIVQYDLRGRRVGYLLHGAINTGRQCVITQACIEYDKRFLGFGQSEVEELMRRCESIGASSIRLRCAENMEALNFWNAIGFSAFSICQGGERRNRKIVEMIKRLDLPILAVKP